MSSIEWKTCAVLGAAGKMGRGISLILLIKLILAAVKEGSGKGVKSYRLVLIDSNAEAIDGLQTYLRSHLQKYAERQINQLRTFYKNDSNLVSNRDMIDHFIATGMQIVHCSTVIEDIVGIQVIFEAVVEDLKVKCALFKKISSLQKVPTYFLSNTSSIPIHQMNAEAGLDGRIIGFHLYNPPAVQKLVEIIPMEGGDPELYDLALEIGQCLDKKIVISKDVAGFIGNGHFLREISAATDLVRHLNNHHSSTESIYMINKVTGDFLLRPMGIFQLIDYVGLDVMQKVGRIINIALKQELYDEAFFNPILQAGRYGGQYADGSQKDGFFTYRDHKIMGIYDASQNSYIPIGQDGNNSLQEQCDLALGPLPSAYIPWVSLSRDDDRQEKIDLYIEQLSQEHRMGCRMAYDFLLQSSQIVQELVDMQVAASREDVETVLKNGFYHLYVLKESAKRSFSKQM